MTAMRNTGIWLSGIIHLIILLIPVSMHIAKRLDFRDAELFVMDETAPVTKTVSIHKKTIIKEQEKTIERFVPPVQTVEPAVESDSKSAIVLSKSEEVSTPKNIEIAKSNDIVAQTQPKTSMPKDTEFNKDTEFGSEFGPKFLHREIPVYPMMARRLGKEGRVLLRLTIDEKGNLLNIEVIEGSGYGFTEAAVAAVKRSSFMPAKIDGMPVMSRALLPIRFNLRRD